MLRLAVATLLLALLPSLACAELRVALVIGNAAYANVGQLSNPARDADAVEALLRAAGFNVVEARRNLTAAAMRRALRDFSDRVRNADIAVVYYAGHGIEVNGNNYLIPVDAIIERDIDVEDETVPLERITQILEQAKRLRLVILDACRDNPFVRSMKRTLTGRSIGRGLAKVDVLTSDTLIAFAAKAGSTAADGEGANSPYTTALVKHLTTPGLDLRLALGRVRDEVLKSTANRQEPFVYGSLGGAEITLVPASKPQPQAAPPSPTAPHPLSEAAEAWGAAKDATNVAVLEAFIVRYKDTYYADLARLRVEELKKLQIAETAKAAPDATADTAAAARGSAARIAMPTPELKAGVRPAPYSGVQAGGLFTEQHAKRIHSLAATHSFNLPDFQIEPPASDVPASLRRFIGVWMEETGNNGKGRKLMLIVTRVDKDGKADGYWLYGPPTVNSFTQSPAGLFKVAGAITGETLRYLSPRGDETFKHSLTSGNRISYHYSNAKGQTDSRVLNPFWTLVEAERSAKR